jgi:hypothetical protein
MKHVNVGVNHEESHLQICFNIVDICHIEGRPIIIFDDCNMIETIWLEMGISCEPPLINTNMTVALLYPDINPSLLLDFANVRALDPRITFTRASGAVYYDGVTTAKAEENLLLRSEEFDNAAWTKTNVAVSGVNTIVAPDGTTTAEEVRDGTASGIHNLFQQLSVTSGVTYVLSCFLKNVDRQFAVVAASTGVAAYASMKVDLVAGTVTASQALGSGWAVTSAAITDVGSGWYRCVLVFVPGSTATGTLRIGMATDGTTFSSSGSGLESYTGTDLKIAAWGAQLEQRSAVTDYTPTTTQPITNYVPVLQTVGNNVARFDHDPVTGESLGLLIEEQRTNLLLRSEEFDNAYWAKTAITVIPNIIIAPDGSLTGDKITETTASSNHSFFKGDMASTATQFTATVYVKSAERSFIMFQNRNNVSPTVGGSNIIFDVASGSVVSVTDFGGGVGQGTITHVGNGWYRCTNTVTVTTAGTQLVFAIFLVNDSLVTNYTGDGYSGVYLWGAQIENGGFATSYIKTEASQVTRLADTATMTGTNFSSWFGGAPEGSVYVEAVSFGLISTSATDRRHFFSFSENTLGIANNQNALFVGGVTNGVFTISRAFNDSTTTSGGSGVTTLVNGQPIKYATAFNSETIQRATNGIAGTDITRQLNSGAFLLLTIGAPPDGIRILNGHMRKLAYYPKQLTATQLQALTR